MCAACGGLSTWLNTWESRTLPDSMKKELTLTWLVFFSFHLQRSSPKSSLTERSTYLVRISAPAPCGRNRGAISPGRVRTATPYFSDCPNQCAALYLVRILTAARCAGCRQAKSPGRVGQSQTNVWGFFLCTFITPPLSDRGQPSPNIKRQNTITVHLFTQSQKRFKRTVHALYKICVFLRQKSRRKKTETQKVRGSSDETERIRVFGHDCMCAGNCGCMYGLYGILAESG